MNIVRSLVLYLRYFLYVYLFLHFPVAMPLIGAGVFSFTSILILMASCGMLYLLHYHDMQVRHTLYAISFKFRQHWFLEAEKRKEEKAKAAKKAQK